MRVFISEQNISKPRPDGRPGWAHVMPGDTPEKHGLDPADCAGYLISSYERDILDINWIEEEIVPYIRQMMEGDPEQKDERFWTQDKRPKVRVIEGVTRLNITEAQRDEAWEIYQREVKDNV